MKSLVIAEKPNAAIDYARALGIIDNNKSKGYLEGEKYIITWALGHLFTLKEPHEYNEKWKNWTLESLPIIPEKFTIKLISGKERQFNIIKSLIERKDVGIIINGGDSGSEGELIQRWIIYSTKTKKPVKRLWIHDLTEKIVKEGFNNLRDINEFDTYYHAANLRSKIDFIIGMTYSRLYTLKLGKSINKTLSIGRCQTPILNLIVERDLERENFKAMLFYEVIINTGEFKATYIKDNNTKIEDREIAE
ncbi:DNA topoisomerase, partial [Clostridium botulinum]